LSLIIVYGKQDMTDPYYGIEVGFQSGGIPDPNTING